ncbi:MAG: PqqD family peptide modification chaperone [Actinomycetota bacterium]
MAVESDADFSVEVRPADVGHELVVDGASLYRASDPGNVLDHLVAWCNRRAVASRPDAVNVHAAGLVAPGSTRAIVIPGAPGAGKTTLAAAACRRGWGYLSDEMVSVEAGMLRSYPKPLTMKQGSLSFVEDLDLSRYELGHQQSRWYISVAELGGWVAERANPHAIVFVGYADHNGTGVTELSVGEATLALAVNCQHELDRSGRKLFALAELADASIRVELEHRDLAEAIDVLEDLAGREPAPTGSVSVLPPVTRRGDLGPAVAPGVSGVATPDGVVLHRHETDGIALLDPLAGTIWRLLDGSASTDQLVVDLAEAFSHPADAVRADVGRLLHDLAENGFVDA